MITLHLNQYAKPILGLRSSQAILSISLEYSSTSESVTADADVFMSATIRVGHTIGHDRFPLLPKPIKFEPTPNRDLLARDAVGSLACEEERQIGHVFGIGTKLQARHRITFLIGIGRNDVVILQHLRSNESGQDRVYANIVLGPHVRQIVAQADHPGF